MLRSTYLRLTLLLGLILAVQSQKCLNCPTNCKTCQLDPIGQVNVQCLSCASGYTFDSYNYVCYSCKAGQYYDPSQASCQSCPSFSSCCTFQNGYLSICGCQSGYSLDSYNGICYKSCTAGQYYDPSQQLCSSCPSGANCCSVKNGIVVICGCVSGQSLDVVNDLCYVNCLSNQYYDSTYQGCLTCPAWSSPCNVTTNGVNSVTCCCNSGYKVDPNSGNCIKTCATNQFYNYTSGNCQNCGNGVKSCANGIVCLTGYTFDPLNNVCYACTAKIQYYNPAVGQCIGCPANSNCCNFTNGILTICGCATGYTLDTVNGLCYKCTSLQYYSYSSAVCVNCPAFATCCSNNNGVFTICGCQSGYTADTVNNICYKSCTSLQYYNPATSVCTSCPGGATCCRFVNGVLTICGCPSGFSVDAYNGVCYKSCTNLQYYDPVQLACISCGPGVGCCTYDAVNDIFSVCGCLSGYTLDPTTGTCYVSCTSLQYYNPAQQVCFNCPQYATCCNFTNGFLSICGCQSGYTLDKVNQVCYKCASNQYYDISQGLCQTCPSGATCCAVKNGLLTICGCPKGYTLDSINQVCYLSCTSAQYYDPSQLVCQNCPTGANCCSFNNGILTICGCIAGESIDPVNNLCYLSCGANQYYEVQFQTCLTCPQYAAVCNVTVGGVSQQSCCCNKGYGLDPTGTFCQKTCLTAQFYNQTSNACVNCPQYASVCPGGIITTCVSGYTLDPNANICYKCSAGQSYDPVTFKCTNCPAGVGCCSINGGVLASICGCLAGYTLDSLNFVCYRCSANQYYDPSSGKCVNCPSCATACQNNGGYITVNNTISGQSWDPVNQICYSCTSTQYYNVDTAVCASCPSCATKCTYLGGGQISVVSVVSGFTWDSNNQVCVKACSTPTYLPPTTSCSSCSGYTYDPVNYVCYKCASLQYYSPQTASCQSCPANANCCGYTNGVFSICGCASGYNLDAVNLVCYKCASGTYWSTATATCNTCPSGASCCTYNKGVVKICGCPKGYTIDSVNNICYLTCTSLQYYDSTQQSCFSCPAGATCCSYANGIISICGCASGQSIDTVNNLCYTNCATNQYYSPAYQSCYTCPAWASVCSNTVNGVSTQGCCCNSGFSLDPTGSYCQKACGAGSYFNLTSGSCVSCPKYAKNCTAIAIISCLTGYTLDPVNNVCYQCSNVQYYNPAIATCQSCPSGASCCTYANNVLSICGCQSGFSFDPYNQVCYKCNAGSYWDPQANPLACQSCPPNVACCNITNGIFSICGCASGYTLDPINGVCYSCKSVQYYNPSTAQCTNCPPGASCCKYVNGIFSICACASGYTLDTANQVCYQCTSTQYYSPAVAACVNCPSCAVQCSVRNGVVIVGQTTKGQSWDSINGVCYTSCVGNQYYDSQQLVCVSYTCPFCATSCTYSPSTGLYTVASTIAGYNWNATSQVCYCNTGQYLSFSASSVKSGKDVVHATTVNTPNKSKVSRKNTPRHLQYAGEIGVPSSFESSLGSTTTFSDSQHERYNFESLTTLQPGSFADKYSLYPWTYTLTAGSIKHLESGRPSLDVTAHTMWGLSSDLCGYFEAISEELNVEPDTHMPTSVEDIKHPCGHYVVFTADLEGSEVSFIHLADGAVQKTLSALLGLTLWFFCF